MRKIKIKEPKMKNINFAVAAYNEADGYGIDIYYDLKKARVFIADYFQTYTGIGFRRITGFSEGTRPKTITAEFILGEIEKINQSITGQGIQPENNSGNRPKDL